MKKLSTTQTSIPMQAIHSFVDRHFVTIAASVVLFELVFNIAIIQYVPYTEIDWKAYMEEVNGWLQGDWDYAHLRGGTGPLVYPAGFLYLFTILKHLTDEGKNIRRAQYIFAMFYCAMMASLFAIYRIASISPTQTRDRQNYGHDGEPNGGGGTVVARSQRRNKTIPALYALILLCASRRIHSIFVLRLFNDGVAMMLLYMAILAILVGKWYFGVLLFSVALSIKMNILLFLPGLIVVVVKRFGVLSAVPRLLLIVLVQVVISLPFLWVNADSYMHGAFEFGRKFFHMWTVNLKFLPEDIFRSDVLARVLLALHLGSLIFFGLFKWCWHEGSIRYILDLLRLRKHGRELTAKHIVTVLFASNFIGIVFARSLHFQFYVWYYHTLPYLLWTIVLPFTNGKPLPTLFKMGILVAIEILWNTFPSTYQSSLTLTILHLSLFFLLLISPTQPPSPAAAAIVHQHQE